MLDLLCKKCGSKWDSEILTRKGTRHCILCSEPGLRYLDAQGNPTDVTFPMTPKQKAQNPWKPGEVIGKVFRG